LNPPTFLSASLYRSPLPPHPFRSPFSGDVLVNDARSDLTLVPGLRRQKGDGCFFLGGVHGAKVPFRVELFLRRSEFRTGFLEWQDGDGPGQDPMTPSKGLFLCVKQKATVFF